MQYIIEKSCNILIIGKSFWKNIVLPSVLDGAAIVNLSENDIQKLQMIENGLHRKILGAFKGTAVESLRGEIGASDIMRTRIIKSRPMYIKYIVNGKKDILRRIMEKSIEDKNKWWKKSLKYIEETKVSLGEIMHKKKEEIDIKIKRWDTAKWRAEMEKKERLSIYRMWKKEIKEEEVYDNRYSSVILFKARTDTLPLNYKNRHSGGNIGCLLCGEEREDLEHFLLDCTEYSDSRCIVIELQKPHEENRKEVIGKFLFEGKDIEKKKEVLQKMWRIRQVKIKEINGL